MRHWLILGFALGLFLACLAANLPAAVSATLDAFAGR